MIGNTPMVELTTFDTGCCQLFVKLENQNPGGSIKDRIALAMVEAAEKSGELKPGGLIVEATAGNTGIALGLIARLKGYPLKIVMPDKMSAEKVSHLRALGAEVIITRSDVTKGHPEYYQDLAKHLASEIPGAYYIDQFNNPNNPKAHEETTGPEIWQQMQQQVDAVVCGVGSGGTLSGLGRFFKKHAPHVEMIIADPNGSIIADMVNTGQHKQPGSWLVEGIGEDFVPSICDLSLASKGYYVSDQEAFQAAYDLLRDEGILGGSSTGALLAGALKYCQEQTTPKRVVTFICDTGNKYLSKMYNQQWLAQQGLTISK
jgi:cystathionine beta-synthase